MAAFLMFSFLNRNCQLSKVLSSSLYNSCGRKTFLSSDCPSDSQILRERFTRAVSKGRRECCPAAAMLSAWGSQQDFPHPTVPAMPRRLPAGLCSSESYKSEAK